MFLRLLVIEMRKTLKHPALWSGLGALLLLLAGMVVIEHAQVAYGYRPISGGLEQDMLTNLLLFTWIGIFMYAVAASVISAFDFPDRSLQIWLTRGAPRQLLLLTRLALVLVFNFILVSLAILALAGLAALSRSLFFGCVDASHFNQAALFSVILCTFWSSLPYLALTVLLAILSRSPLFAAGGTIVFARVFEPLLGRLDDQFPQIIQYLPGRLVHVLLSGSIALDRTALIPAPDPNSLSQLHAALSAGIIYIVLSLISLVIFSRQDFGG